MSEFYYGLWKHPNVRVFKLLKLDTTIQKKDFLEFRPHSLGSQNNINFLSALRTMISTTNSGSRSTQASSKQSACLSEFHVLHSFGFSYPKARRPSQRGSDRALYTKLVSFIQTSMRASCNRIDADISLQIDERTELTHKSGLN